MCCVPRRSGASDSHPSVIRLLVIDEKNSPVPDAVVEIRTNEKIVSTASTDATGKTTLRVDVAGTYSLDVQKKGYLITATALEVSEGSAAQDIEVVLSTVALNKESVEVKVKRRIR